jgi:hypothetical protein
MQIYSPLPPLGKPSAPELINLIAARRFRLLIDLDYSPELSTEILNSPILFHRIVGARDPGTINPRINRAA